MPLRPAAGAPFAAWTAQRVEVYLAVPAASTGGLLTVPAREWTRVRLPGVVLAHGEHPRHAAARALALALDAGCDGADEVAATLDPATLRVHRVLSQVRPLPRHPGLHVLQLILEPDRGLPLPVDPGLLRDPAPAPITDEVPGAPPRVQRPAAYAVVVLDEHVLLTRVRGSGMWTLPGGGIDHGEHPDDAVRRETLEETGLPLVAADLVDVDSHHFTGRSPRAVTEDFHGVRLLYRGVVGGRGEPAVQEVGGTTDAAAWWPLAQLRGLHLSSVVRPGLTRLRHRP